jgi:hypothetical protein
MFSFDLGRHSSISGGILGVSYRFAVLKLLAIYFFKITVTYQVGFMIKEQVLDIIQSLPEDVSLDRILEELFFKLVIDSSLKQLDEGKGIPHSEVVQEFLYA